MQRYELMKRITPSDREILGFQHPEQLLLMSVPVPPVCIRPTALRLRNSRMSFLPVFQFYLTKRKLGIRKESRGEHG